MNADKKRKVRNIALLALLGLIGGTFAFTAFNQQAINDRERENLAQVGGRVHDYFNREEENKDVFVENFGQEPLMARLRLSEYMAIQKRGQSEWTSVVSTSDREDTSTWSTYIPSANNLTERTGEGYEYFNQFSRLSFGREGAAPWFLPTFNTVYDENHALFDLSAAAGDALDYASGGYTHPGDGTDNFWDENDSVDNSAGRYQGATVTRETAQNLTQNLPPMSLQAWTENPRTGNFWVIDHNTGWTYWANRLQPGQATSYLIDEARMLEGADNIPGSYYYAIHVSSELISPGERFSDEPDHVNDFLSAVRASDGNPLSTASSPLRDFNFNAMNPGRIFTTEDDQAFRYLENQGSGNHMIIRNEVIPDVSFEAQESQMETWFNSGILPELRALVQPVADEFTTGELNPVDLHIVDFAGLNFVFMGMSTVPFADITQVVSDGNPRAFALSLIDVNRVSGANHGFTSVDERVGPSNSWWWLRTPSFEQHWFPEKITLPMAWQISNAQFLVGTPAIQVPEHSASDGGIRPALIIHQ